MILTIDQEQFFDPTPLYRLGMALTVSAAVHMLLLFALGTPPTQVSTPIEISLEPDHVEATIPGPQVPLTPPKQIVSPSEAPQGLPKESSYISDRDSVTEREQIRRGLEDAKPVPPLAQARKQISPPKSSAVKNDSQKIPATSSLRLRPDEVAQQLSLSLKSKEQGERDELVRKSAGAADKEQNLSDEQREIKLREYQPFIKNSAQALFSGRTGSADYLPQIPDGEITLLNAKADRHAVFVRRVALQVFGALRKRSWVELARREVQELSDFVTAHAVMTRDGKLLKAEIEQSSGIPAFDAVVLQSVRAGAWDQNPPAGALAKDGKIHFIFKSKTWSRVAGDIQREQRWLLLSTGLL